MNVAQLARHHAWRQFDAAADGDVKTFADQVYLAVIEMAVGNHARIAADEFASSGTT